MKNKTIREIKTAFPDIKSQRVEDFSFELDRVLNLKQLFESDGGKELIKVLRDGCSRDLIKLIAAAKGEPTLPILLGIISSYSAKVDLLSQLRDISFEDELREQLDKAVIDAME